MQLPSEVALLSAVAFAAFAFGALILYSVRRRVGDPEVRRRALIHGNGRIIEGMVTDYRDGVVYYTWSWRGVDYESSQDLSGLADRIPAEEWIVGPVSVKFLPNVPSNSIVLSEKWSGLRSAPIPQRVP